MVLIRMIFLNCNLTLVIRGECNLGNFFLYILFHFLGDGKDIQKKKFFFFKHPTAVKKSAISNKKKKSEMSALTH